MLHFMRHFLLMSLILSATFLFEFTQLTNPMYIIGHLRKNPKDTSAYIEGIAIIVKGDGKILAKTVTDINGDFDLSFTPKEKSFYVFYIGLGIDKLLLASIERF